MLLLCRSFFIAGVILVKYVKELISVLCCISFFSYGCGNSESQKYSRDIFAMDTYMQLTAYGNNCSDALDKAEAEIYRLEKLLSVTDENSEMYVINNSHGNKISVSRDVSELIKFGIDMNKETNGCLDITIYPVLKEWGFTTGEYSIPDSSRITKLLENCGVEKISLSENNIILKEGIEIDMGSIAKGYTSDRIVDILKENGVESAIVSLGGNVSTLGKKADSSLWSVAVTDPFSPDKSIGILKVDNKAVVTSGDYERYFTGDDGKKYCHIINPKTGCPTDNNLVSVTIVNESGLKCDALSTALFVMGKDDAEEYWKSHNDFEMILVEKNEKIIISEGIADSFKNTSGMTVEVIYRES